MQSSWPQISALSCLLENSYSPSKLCSVITSAVKPSHNPLHLLKNKHSTHTCTHTLTCEIFKGWNFCLEGVSWKQYSVVVIITAYIEEYINRLYFSWITLVQSLHFFWVHCLGSFLAASYPKGYTTEKLLVQTRHHDRHSFFNWGKINQGTERG